MLTIPFLVSLTRGPHLIQYGVDAEKSPRHKQAVTNTLLLYIFYDTNATRVPVKNGKKRRYPTKLTANCSPVWQL